MKYTRREIFGLALLFLLSGCSVIAWKFFYQTVLTPGIADTWESLPWFSGAGMAFFLGAVVWKRTWYRFVGPLCLFFPALLFHFSPYLALYLALALLVSAIAIKNIVFESQERLRFAFFKNARAGQFAFIFALSLALSAAYFVTVKDQSWSELVPRFGIGEGMSSLIFKTAASLRPDLQALTDQDVSVNTFLLDMRALEGQEGGVRSFEVFALPEAGQNVTGVYDGDISEEFAEAMYLRAGREQLSELAGRTIRGDERIADVLSSAIEQRITGIFQGEEKMKMLPAGTIPFFLSLLLFLTLLPLGAIVVPVWMLFSSFFFWCAIRFHWLKFDAVSRDQQVLAG